MAIELTDEEVKSIMGALSIIPKVHFHDGGDSFHSHSCGCSDCRKCRDISATLGEKLKAAKEGRMTESHFNAYVEGLTAYAWWRDGEEYVGTCGTTLKEAICKARQKFLEGK